MKKLLSLTLALCMLLTLLAGCSGGGESSTSTADTSSSQGTSSTAEEEPAADPLADLPDTYDETTNIAATPEMYPDVDLSSDYTVNLYQVGDKPNDYDQVEAAINEYLAPFNTKIATTFISWSDVGTMYSLVLAGGEQVDLIFTAPWEYMYVEAAKGSFLTLEDEFLQKYMPLSYKYQPEESWGETTIQGKLVAVPSADAAPQGKIVAVRKDLMDKYDIADLETWDDYMNYCLTIAEKETPESGVYALAAAGNTNELWDVYRQMTDTFLALDSNYMDFIYEYTDGIPAVEDIQFVYEYEPFREYAKDMKTLADAGCWSRSALTNTISDDDAFASLQGASIAWNTSVFTYMKRAEENEGVECMAYDLTKDNLVTAEAYSNNDMAIAAGSKNPERSAMVLDMLKFDTTLNRLMCLGIEGTHYEWNDDNTYSKLDAKTADFAPMAPSVSWAVKNGTLQEAGTPERELAITEPWKERVVMNPTITFVFDDTEIKAEVAAVTAVLEDYVPMIELGLVDDVDVAMDEMIQRCNDSGLQTVKDALAEQYEAWAATR